MSEKSELLVLQTTDGRFYIGRLRRTETSWEPLSVESEYFDNKLDATNELLKMNESSD